MFSGFASASIGTVSVTTMPARSALGEPLERVLGEDRRGSRRPRRRSRPAPSAPAAPARSVPPVMITSSPTSATLPRTRPVISVTAATSCAGRVLFMIAKSASSISAKRTATFARPASGATETIPSPGEAEVAEVAREQRQRRHVVDRDREEALDLARVQVHRQHAVGAGELEHVGDEPPGDRLARPRLAVLPRVREPGDHGGDPLRRAELRRLDHQQQLHQVPVDRVAAGLDEEDVGAADRLEVAAVRLAVGERGQLDVAELDAELARRCSGRAPGASGRRRPSAASGARARANGPAPAWACSVIALEAGEPHELSRRHAFHVRRPILPS